MRYPLILVVLSSLLVLAPVGGEESSCDLKTVEKVFFCHEHEVLLPSELVSNVTYYVCEDCESSYEKPGECELCGETLQKKVSGKDVCPHCFAKPEPAEACVKTYFECPMCECRSATPGKCEDCDEEMEKCVSRALVEYVCPDCGHFSLKPGKCPDPDCSHAGKPLVRTCSESGTYPHVGARAKPD